MAHLRLNDKFHFCNSSQFTGAEPDWHLSGNREWHDVPLGGIMISRPGGRTGIGLDADLTPGSIELAQFASRPLLLGVVMALLWGPAGRDRLPPYGFSGH